MGHLFFFLRFPQRGRGKRFSLTPYTVPPKQVIAHFLPPAYRMRSIEIPMRIFPHKHETQTSRSQSGEHALCKGRLGIHQSQCIAEYSGCFFFSKAPSSLFTTYRLATTQLATRTTCPDWTNTSTNNRKHPGSHFSISPSENLITWLANSLFSIRGTCSVITLSHSAGL